MNKSNKEEMMRHYILLIIMLLAGSTARAEDGDSTKVYTAHQPLVYEDAWDMWPYSFLDDSGDPAGFNIDLIRLLMEKLNIPYVIKLKPAAEAFNDLKEGRSDLMLGLATGYNEEFGHYSQNAVTLFTLSVATPKSKKVMVKNFHDLSKEKVIVSEGSLCHNLMLDYGWGANALPTDDMREAIQQVSAQEEGQIVWNSLSLKWLMQRYHIDNLELTPVNMPHGEYKFMSNDTQLLDRLDAAYTELYSGEELLPLQNKWFYPERLEKPIPTWLWALMATTALLLVLLSIYSISYRIQARRLRRQNERDNKRLAMILETSQMRIWTYDIESSQFAWHNENGQVGYTYTMDDFSHRYSPDDFAKLKSALGQLSQLGKDEANKELTLELRAKDIEDDDSEMRDYRVVLAVFRRNKEGQPTVIICTRKDITKELQVHRLSAERTLRYWSIFYTPIVGIIMFDRNGVMTNINPKACELFECNSDEALEQHTHLSDLLDTGGLRLEQTEGYYATLVADMDRQDEPLRQVKFIHKTGRMYMEFLLMTVYDDNHEFSDVLAICRDVSGVVSSIDQQSEMCRHTEAVRAEVEDYANRINTVLSGSDVRLASYSPVSHTLTIYSRNDEVSHALPQTRCMTLVDEHSKSIAMHMLNRMDKREQKTVEATVTTTLRIKGQQLVLQFKLQPVSDAQGKVTEYQGLCQDISELCHLQGLLAVETEKVQEVENTKNSFVKNMVQEIRTPMSTVINYVAQLGDKAPTDNEPMLQEGILNNADYLLHLIDNVLYLSRLEAHMVEINRTPCDFAQLFESQCNTGWAKYQNANTRYVIENPYEQLVVDVDAENIGHAIEQLTANAAQHTAQGIIRTHYEYIGRRLIITVDDTGEGIPKKEVARLNSQQTNMAHHTKGLGLIICKELVSQMGGTVEISSEVGEGTTVYIMIPCQATIVKRKKQKG